jgi:hypothetical protein
MTPTEVDAAQADRPAIAKLVSHGGETYAEVEVRRHADVPVSAQARVHLLRQGRPARRGKAFPQPLVERST